MKRLFTAIAGVLSRVMDVVLRRKKRKPEDLKDKIEIYPMW